MPANQTIPAQPFTNPQGTPAFNVSESPVVQSPGGKTSTSVTTTGGSRKGIMGLVLLVLVLIAAGIGGLYYVKSTQQPEPTVITPTVVESTARITLEPGAGTLDSGLEHQIQFSIDLSNTPVTLSNVTFKVNFGGSIPADITFIPTPDSVLPAPVPTFTDVDSGKTLEVSYAFEKNIVATNKKVALGTLKFTAPGSGQLNIRFDSAGSKVITAPNNIDILRPPSIISYTFQPAAEVPPTSSESAETSTATTSALLAQASLSPTPVASGTAKPTTTPTRTPTATPTKAAGASAVGGAASTATPTPTKTATPTKTPTSVPTSKATATPIASESAARSNSQPAKSQALPVSGNEEFTIKTIGLGILLLISGLVLWPKLRRPKTPDSQ